MHLKQIIENTDTSAGRSFDLAIQGLILLSLISFSFETIPDLSSETRSILHLIELFTVTIFTIEYFLRLFVADRKFRYIFSFYGIVDLLAILPFYLSVGFDLRSLRVFRLLRLMRLFKLNRYHDAGIRLRTAFSTIKEELILFLVLTAMMLYLTSVGIYYFENQAQPEIFRSVFHSLWWSVTTLTTVGYGDVYPVTTGGKIFTFVVLMIGLGLVSVPAGLLASALSKIRTANSNNDTEKPAD